jgi:hypothetical protein
MLSEKTDDLSFSGEDLDAIRNELERLCNILVKYAEDRSRQIDETDRQHILLYLRDKKLPEYPNTIPQLMTIFASSALSYHINRDYLTSVLGSIPKPETIGYALNKLFGEFAFEKEDCWCPETLNATVDMVCAKRGWGNNDLGNRKPESSILGILKDGALWFADALANGLEPYFLSVNKHLTSPEEAWDYLCSFSYPIRNFGPSLAADYLKNAGFHQFVKPDIHLLREFPRLVGLPHKMGAREVFIIGWRLSAMLEVPAFYLDHVLYQWGRHGNQSRSQTVPQTRTTAGKTTRTTKIGHSPEAPPKLRPESIGSRIYPGLTIEEIRETNPFVVKSWLTDTAELSRKRLDAIDALFSGRREARLADIQSRTQNAGKYAAFRAIAHGIARWDAVDEKLILK